MSAARYYVFRTIQTVAFIFLALTFLFFLFRLMPGDFASLMLSQGVTGEAVEQFRESWGLNDPLYVQYWRYVTNMLQGDAGRSLQYRESVWTLTKLRIFNSFILVAPAITIAYLLGGILGTLAGTNRDTSREEFTIGSVLFMGAIPEFVTAMFLIIIFASVLGIFPTSGMLSTSTILELAEAPWWRPYLTTDFALHYVLPFSAIVIRYLYLPTLIMRTNVGEVLGQDFFLYHRVTGLSGRTRFLNLMKHASLPVITIYPISLTRAIGGLVLVETVFNWPGIGFLLVEAILRRDFPVVQFVFFLVAAFIIIANFVVDIVYGFIDPRVSVSE